MLPQRGYFYQVEIVPPIAQPFLPVFRHCAQRRTSSDCCASSQPPLLYREGFFVLLSSEQSIAPLSVGELRVAVRGVTLRRGIRTTAKNKAVAASMVRILNYQFSIFNSSNPAAWATAQK
ncbi:MAG: hypothetical protein IJ244_08995 [Bacteroidaceae bacterium]|nr:hypothetical protein [Bacteroidaceae bacterium]